jgi:stage II sporulation protein P
LNISPNKEDLSHFSASDGKIAEKTFTANKGANYINLNFNENGGTAGQIRNATDLPTDKVADECKKLPDIKLKLDGTPEVLIMHTHTSESYQPNERGYYDTSYTSRCVDPEKSVVAVGAEIASALSEAGIGVIHDGTVHDYPQYQGSYERSAKTIEKVLKEYPTIKIVLDIHRDAIASPDGTLIAPVAMINGKKAAQVMIISAADDGSNTLPHYMKNLRFASLIQSETEAMFNGLTRPVLFQYCDYNQNYTTGSLLIEVGSNGNTLEEAKYTGRLLGESLSAALWKLKGKELN